MVDSQLILELMFLHIRGGYSLMVLIFFLMLVGICCFILSASLCVVRPTYPSFTSTRKFINYTTFLGGRNKKKIACRTKKLSVCQKNVAAFSSCCLISLMVASNESDGSV